MQWQEDVVIATFALLMMMSLGGTLPNNSRAFDQMLISESRKEKGQRNRKVTH